MRKTVSKGNSTQEHIEKQGASTEKKKQPSLQSSLNAPFHQRKIQASIANPNRKFLRIFPPNCRRFSPFFGGGSWKEKKNTTSMWGYGPECLCSSSTEVLCHYQDPKTWPRRKCNGKICNSSFWNSWRGEIYIEYRTWSCESRWI